MLIIIGLIAAGILFTVYHIENAPYYDEDRDIFIYKEWVQFLGIKFKKRKKLNVRDRWFYWKTKNNKKLN